MTVPLGILSLTRFDFLNDSPFNFLQKYVASFAKKTNNMMGASRLPHLGINGPFSSLGPVSSH
ncbi:unnamed protein product, partial [Rotaria magnacalcarata]